MNVYSFCFIPQHIKKLWNIILYVLNYTIFYQYDNYAHIMNTINVIEIYFLSLIIIFILCTIFFYKLTKFSSKLYDLENSIPIFARTSALRMNMIFKLIQNNRTSLCIMHHRNIFISIPMLGSSSRRLEVSLSIVNQQVSNIYRLCFDPHRL